MRIAWHPGSVSAPEITSRPASAGHVRKGNLYVRRPLCEFAHAAGRTQSVFKSTFQSLVIRRGYQHTVVAIGHKILRSLFFRLKRREPYRDSATDYEALSVQHNALAGSRH